MRIIKRLAKEYGKKENENILSDEVFALEGRLLNQKISTEHIIKLTDSNGRAEYFYMEYTPTAVSALFLQGRLVVNLQQLTGDNAGRYFTIKHKPNNTFNSNGYFLVDEYDSRYLKIGLVGFNGRLINVADYNEFEKAFGKTVTMKDLLEMYNAEKDNQNENSDIR